MYSTPVAVSHSKQALLHEQRPPAMPAANEGAQTQFCAVFQDSQSALDPSSKELQLLGPTSNGALVLQGTETADQATAMLPSEPATEPARSIATQSDSDLAAADLLLLTTHSEPGTLLLMKENGSVKNKSAFALVKMGHAGKKTAAPFGMEASSASRAEQNTSSEVATIATSIMPNHNTGMQAPPPEVIAVVNKALKEVKAHAVSIEMPMQIEIKPSAPTVENTGALQQEIECDRHGLVETADVAKPMIFQLPELRENTSGLIQAATSFQHSLFSRGHDSEIVFQDDDVPVVADEPSVMPSALPMKKLDVQWNDATFGNISLKAEMRDGTVHTTLHSDHVTSAVSLSDLHAFLETNRVGAHEVQVSVGTPLSHALKMSGSSETSADSNAASGSGSQAPPRRGHEQQRMPPRHEERSDRSAMDSNQMLRGIAPGNSTMRAPQPYQQLSIHI